ncbi:MAG: hypothetical protein AAF639_05785 [Chloroflexota bacterium]
MLSAQLAELQLPSELESQQENDFQRSVIYHLLVDKKIKVRDALPLLSTNDQQWLVSTILHTAQETLFVACHISDESWSQTYWQRYRDLLGHLFVWFHQDVDVSYHGQLLSILRTITRRYQPMQLTATQIEYIQRLTMRLHEKHLSQDDITEITYTLENDGLHTLMDLAPIADELFASYVAELGRD